MHATPGATWLDASIIGHLADIGDADRKIGSNYAALGAWDLGVCSRN